MVSITKKELDNFSLFTIYNILKTLGAVLLKLRILIYLDFYFLFLINMDLIYWSRTVFVALITVPEPTVMKDQHQQSF